MIKFESVDELQKYYSKFTGEQLGTLHTFIQSNFPHISLKTNKGIVGQVLEAIIGNPPNSSPHADVKNLGVELKVLPLRKANNKLQPKERSKIKSINYKTIVEESWYTSDLKSKIEIVLFLLYEQPTGKTYKDWKQFIFKGTLIHRLDSSTENIVKEDWEGIQYKVKNKNADQLSEGDGKILGACTSGTGKLVLYNQKSLAKQRSYSFKHSYLKTYYFENKKRVKYESLSVDSKLKLEEYVVDKINQEFEGKSLRELVERFDVKFSSNSKSGFSNLIKALFKISKKAQIRDFDENGIVIKTVPIDFKKTPFEAMSFPKFSLVDLIDEEWEPMDDCSGDGPEAVFKNIISQTFIFIPIIKNKRNKKYNHWHEWKLGKSVSWKANYDELKIIENEWSTAKKLITDNKVEVWKEKHGDGFRQMNNLLKSKETKIIHLRPHAKNSDDIDIPYFEYTNGKIRITWQSFWLNKSFVESKLK